MGSQRHLYDRLNGALAENATSQKEIGNLKTKTTELRRSNEELTKNILDLQDEFRVHKHNSHVENSNAINRSQSAFASNSNNRKLSNSNTTFPSLQRTFASAASVPPPTQATTVLMTPQDVRSEDEHPVTKDPLQTVGWTKVEPKKKLVRGSQRPVLDSPVESDTLLGMSTLKHEPHMDFNVQGIPRLEDTKHSNMKEYNDHYKAALIKAGIRVRFVSVYQPPEGSTRGCTSMRFGTYESDREKVLDSSKWPRNCFVAKWDFNRKSSTNNTTNHFQKNQ